jgi:transcriptional regulator with XRE-family HTH domain
MNTKPIPDRHKKQLELIGLYLKNLRINENLTQEEVSVQVNLHQNTIQRVERGMNTNVTTILILALFYDHQPSILFSILD